MQGSAKNAATHENVINSSYIEGRTPVQASENAPRNEEEKHVKMRMEKLRILKHLGSIWGSFWVSFFLMFLTFVENGESVKQVARAHGLSHQPNKTLYVPMCCAVGPSSMNLI